MGKLETVFKQSRLSKTIPPSRKRFGKQFVNYLVQNCNAIQLQINCHCYVQPIYHLVQCTLGAKKQLLNCQLFLDKKTVVYSVYLKRQCRHLL